MRKTGKGSKTKRKKARSLSPQLPLGRCELADKMLSSGYVRLDCEVGSNVEELSGKLKDTHEQRPGWYLDDDDSCGLYDPLFKVVNVLKELTETDREWFWKSEKSPKVGFNHTNIKASHSHLSQLPSKTMNWQINALF